MNRIEQIIQAWDAVLEDEFWDDLTDEELRIVQDLLWNMHKEALLEWTRRKMVKEQVSISPS